MSAGHVVASKKRARCLRRQDTPSADDEVFYVGWLIYQNLRRTNAVVPIGPPIKLSGLEALLISSSVQWLKKIAFNHASYCRTDTDAVLILVNTLNQMVKAAYRAQAGFQEIMPASTAEGSSAMLSDSSDDEDGITAIPGSSRDGAEVAVGGGRRSRKIPQGAWVAIDLAQFGLGTISVGTSSHAYFLYIQHKIEDVRTVVSLARFFGRELASRPPNEGLCTIDEQRIVWSHPRHAFKVLVCRPPSLWRRYKIFKVERRDRAGILYDDDAAILENSRVLRAARKYWNAVDESFEMRYPAKYLEPPAAD
jgi:hypothetical protein